MDQLELGRLADNGSSNIVTGEYRLEHKKLRIVD